MDHVACRNYNWHITKGKNKEEDWREYMKGDHKQPEHKPKYFWDHYLVLDFRGRLVCCDVPLMWCTLRWYDIKVFGLFYFF